MPDIETIIDSVGKLRILNLLSKKGELNITAIAKQTKLNHTSVINHLGELKELNVICEKRFGRIKIFTINPNSEAGERLIQFFSSWERERAHKNRVKG